MCIYELTRAIKCFFSDIKEEELEIGENRRILIHHIYTPHRRHNKYINQPCSICLEEMNHTKEYVFILEKCGHAFHKNCLYQWLCMDKHDCPLCRTSLYNKKK